MAVVQSAEQAVLFGLTFKELGIIFTAISAVVFFVVKPFYDNLHERFLKGRKLTKDELEKLSQDDADEWLSGLDSEKQAEIRRAYALHQDLAQIKENHLSKRYTNALDGLQRLLSKWFGEKLHYSDQLTGINGLFGAQVFTPKSYVFCLTLAFFYPLLFMLLSWQFNGELSIAGHPFIGYMAVELRVLALLLIIPSFGLFYWGGPKKEK